MIHTKGSQRCIIQGDVIIIESDTDNISTPEKDLGSQRPARPKSNNDLKELTQQVNTVNELELQLKVLESKAQQIERQRRQIQASLSETKVKLIHTKSSPAKPVEQRPMPVKRGGEPRYHPQVIAGQRIEERTRSEQQRLMAARRIDNGKDNVHANLSQQAYIQQTQPQHPVAFHENVRPQKDKEAPSFARTSPADDQTKDSSPEVMEIKTEAQLSSKPAGKKNQDILEKLSPDELIRLAKLFRNEDYVEKAAEKGGDKYAKVGKELLGNNEEKSQPKASKQTQQQPLPSEQKPQPQSSITTSQPVMLETKMMRVPPPQRVHMRPALVNGQQSAPQEQTKSVMVKGELDEKGEQQQQQLYGPPPMTGSISPSNFVSYRMHCRVENTVTGLNPLRNLSPWQLVEMGQLFENPMYLDLAEWMSKKNLLDLSDPDYKQWLSEYQMKIGKRHIASLTDDSLAPATKFRRLSEEDRPSEAPVSSYTEVNVQQKKAYNGPTHKICYLPAPENKMESRMISTEKVSVSGDTANMRISKQQMISTSEMIITSPIKNGGKQNGVAKANMTNDTPGYIAKSPTVTKSNASPGEGKNDNLHTSPIPGPTITAVPQPPHLYPHPSWPNVAIAYIPVPVDHLPPGTIPYLSPHPPPHLQPYYHYEAQDKESSADEEYSESSPEMAKTTPKPPPVSFLTASMAEDVRVKLEPLSPTEENTKETDSKHFFNESPSPYHTNIKIKQEQPDPEPAMENTKTVASRQDTNNTRTTFRLYKDGAKIAKDFSKDSSNGTSKLTTEETVPVPNLVSNEKDPLHQIKISAVVGNSSSSSGSSKKKGYFPIYKRPRV